MSQTFTEKINDRNVHNVRQQILLKQGSRPFLATENEGAGVLTDYDSFPYPRWFRGVYYSQNPIVAEREAGYRPRHDDCYNFKTCPGGEKPDYPNHCFSAPCSTVYPCYPEQLKWADREALHVILNKACVPEYR